MSERVRQVVVPRFGKKLRELREMKAGYSQQQVVNGVVGTFGLKFDRSSLAQWEAGTVAGPDVAILWALARIYDEPLEDLCLLLASERSSRALAEDRTTAVLSPDERSLVETFRQAQPSLRIAALSVLESGSPLPQLAAPKARRSKVG